MKYPEEDIARDLHRELVRRFSALSPTLDGVGVHWHCTIRRDDRECRIACFMLPQDREYYTSFQEDSQTIAYSRIPSRDDTLEAVTDWLNGTDLATLYDRYGFIDATKRRLVQIRDQAISAEPELQRSAESELAQQIGDIYYLVFRGSERSCEISFYGKNERPDAKYSWDECQLFECQPHDIAQFATALRGWLCDKLKPSEMRLKFPWLIIGELADYYEAGKPIEGEFIKSWDWMEEFYKDSRYPFADEVKALMGAMRSRGYHKSLRAGQSLWSLILSRSRRHGMRKEQPCVQF
ncbi:MAG: hypothetical protein ACU837_12980 [Gammaproteobacteria bacterium]